MVLVLSNKIVGFKLSVTDADFPLHLFMTNNVLHCRELWTQCYDLSTIDTLTDCHGWHKEMSNDS